jgi:glucose-6-phosphate isomerase
MKFAFNSNPIGEHEGSLLLLKKIAQSGGSKESSLPFLFDQTYISNLEKVLKNINHEKIKTVFVVGIGGANLASKVLYDATAGYLETIIDQEKKMIFLDTNDGGVMEAIVSHISNFTSIEDFVVVIVSKSGKTIETLSNSEFIINRLEVAFGNVASRIIVVTATDSPLWFEAKQKNILSIALPFELSDRFSAFSPTTIVPLLVFGFPVSEFYTSAFSALQSFTTVQSKDISMSASMVVDEYTKGNHIFDLFFFNTRLETMGKWHRQLIAESLGKDTTVDGVNQITGFTPTVSIGTTDLHSVLQLNLAGPKERVTQFVFMKEHSNDNIGSGDALYLLSESITNKKPEELTEVILESVQASYNEKNLPFFSIELSPTIVTAVAEYMVYAMIQTVLIGNMWNINVFNQPNVEGYKNATKQKLT